MKSLRARLLVALLAISAAGLLLVGGITYAEQRSFLYDRVDQQTEQAIGVVGRKLSEAGVGGLPTPDDHGGPGDHGGGPDFGLPAGIYGERRSTTGKVLGHVVLSNFEETTQARPDIPSTLPLDALFTVKGTGSDHNRYRVFAQQDPTGNTTVAAVPLREVDQTLHRLLLVEALVIGGVLLLLATVSGFVVRLGLRPLDRIGETAQRIAGGDLSHRVESTDARTEVGRLGTALNQMLDRLEHAFAEREASEDRLRQFLADASHELRTPLASIRGYAELFRMGATRDPEELERSMRRIEDEAARMGVLVEDLLALARLDQIAENEHVPVDLEELVEDAAHDGRATAPSRAISARIEGEVTVLGETDQLRQVLANLVRNALVHTPDGTPVDLAAVRTDGAVVLTVRDHGPGLPPDADPEAIFERFWRAEAGRERGKAGAGLGLAIVAAIVRSHGGTVSAANAADGGAVFTVRLPAAGGDDGLGPEPTRERDRLPARVA